MSFIVCDCVCTHTFYFRFNSRKVYPKLVDSVYVPFVHTLKSFLNTEVKERKEQDVARGWFAPDYEPSKEEIQSVHTVPQSGIRGVGWNGSTRAWVASWLPPNNHKRFCATFSTRKFGYHLALKMAICQRLRAELSVYERRKYPITDRRNINGTRPRRIRPPPPPTKDLSDLLEEDEDGKAKLPTKRGPGRPSTAATAAAAAAARQEAEDNQRFLHTYFLASTQFSKNCF